MFGLLQTTMSIDPEMLDQLNDLQDLQDIDLGAITDLAANPATQQALGSAGMLAGWAIFFAVIFLVVAAVFSVLSLMNIYHWGMTDKAEFAKVNEDKKKWFWIIVVVPIVAAFVGMIPVIGWFVAFVAYIYWAVMVLTYFIKKRKIGRSTEPVV